MKLKEKKLAQTLRRQGFSLRDIQKKLKVSKGSISIWVRDIPLTKTQKQKLSEKGISKEIIEKRRSTRLAHENTRRELIVDTAKKDIISFSQRELFITGVIFYWAEGGKTQRGLVRFTNGDPCTIEIMMHFFRKICQVPESKFRGHIHLHPHLNKGYAEVYWSKISGIPVRQFFKTYNKPNRSSQNKKDSLPFGTFDIYICDTELFLKLKGWREKIYELIKIMPS